MAELVAEKGGNDFLVHSFCESMLLILFSISSTVHYGMYTRIHLSEVGNRGHPSTAGCMIQNQRFLVVKIQTPVWNAVVIVWGFLSPMSWMCFYFLPLSF